MKSSQLGTIASFTVADAVGRIRLDDRTEVRFGASALGDIVPVVGLRVAVEAMEPHPLGGMRATSMRLAYSTVACEAARERFATEAAEHSRTDLDRWRREQQARAGSVEPDPLTPEQERELRDWVDGAEARVRQHQAHLREAGIRSRLEVLGADHSRTLEQRRELLVEHGASESAITELVNAARPAAQLVGLPDPNRVPVGASKLGGLPDLPEDQPWPRKDMTELAFLAQVDLTSVPPAVKRSLALPEDGLLSFFYDARDCPWGFDPGHAGGWRVLHLPTGAALARRAPPSSLSADDVFQELRVQVREELVLPPADSLLVARLDLEDHEREKLVDGLAEIEERGGCPRHLLGGLAEPIQSAMEERCQLAFHGIYAVDESGWKDSRVQGLREGVAQWRLLLQLDTDDLADMMWGDGGRLYFWMRESDLNERRFDRSWCILQCY